MNATAPDPQDPEPLPRTTFERLRRLLVGSPRDLRDRRIFHHIALIPILAWVGLGADGLSSSAYGPEEAFRALGEHKYLAVALAVATAATVFVIAAAYSRLIEVFPQGGGGYVVATALLGPRLGLISGAALLIDYVLTITISIAAAGAALFSFLPLEWNGWRVHDWKVHFDLLMIVLLTVLNVRGLKESVLVMLPIFVLFAGTHLVTILGGFIGHIPQAAETAGHLGRDFQSGAEQLGWLGLILLFLHAYSLGGGTYTGIEAVSNGLQILREPRVQNGKRTMRYMAISLAFVASSLLLLYLIWDVEPQPGKTMNAVLLQAMTDGIPGGHWFALATILSQGALLIVAAQAGFVGGPRTLANMAADSWVPHRFSAVCERLTTHNGIALMGVASAAALIYTQASVSHLVVLYSINVFITFSLSTFGMLKRSWQLPRGTPRRAHDRALYGVAFLLCSTILVVTIFEKFHHGGWLTLVVTGSVVLLCLWIRRHYQTVYAKLNQLYAELEKLPQLVRGTPGALQPSQPTAAILVGGYGGLGIHTLMNIFRAFPDHFRNIVFVSVGVLDSGEFKGEETVDALRARTQAALDRYVALADKLGIASTSRMAIGTDVVEQAETLCLEVTREFPRTTFFAGKVIFSRENWYHRLLHNETAFAVQKRLQWAGFVMVILPARVR